MISIDYLEIITGGESVVEKPTVDSGQDLTDGHQVCPSN